MKQQLISWQRIVLAIIAIACVLTSLFIASIPAANAQGITTESRGLLFNSDRDGDDDIYLSNADGSYVRQLTNNTDRQDVDASWAPDGRSFVYTSLPVDTTPQIFRYDMATGKSAALTNNPNLIFSHPGFSPDGTRIISRTRDVNSQSCLDILDIQTLSHKRLLCSEGRVSYDFPNWSPDGTRIAFTVFDGGINRYSVRADGIGDMQLLVRGALNSVFSPDGKRLAFSRAALSVGETEQVFVANADGTNERQLTSDTYRSRRPVDWSSDGTQLILISFGVPDFTIGIRTLQPDGTGEYIFPVKADGINDFASNDSWR